MNKQELIEQIKGLKNLFGNKAEYIEIDAAIKLIEQLDEPQKPVVPQFVADWYEENNNNFENNIYDCIVGWGIHSKEIREWVRETKSFQTLVNMHQFGYTVEEEKRYLVKIKGVACPYLNYDTINELWFYNQKIEGAYTKTKHTRKELEQAGFSDVFNSPLFEVEEVEG